LDAAYKWTIDEYVLRCEQAGEDLREILVEGQLDRDLILDALHRWGVADVVVRDAQFISTDRGSTPGEGPSGVKAALVRLAEALHEAARKGRLLATLRIVVDRDYDAPPDAGPYLLLTDGHSMESYAFGPEALDRFVRLILGRAPAPSGRGGVARQNRLTVRGKEVYDRILPAAIGVGAARLVVLHLSPPAGLGESWDRYLATTPSGKLTISAVDLIEHYLTTAGRSSEVERAVADVSTREEEVEENPQQLVRGHDFVTLLLKLLRTPWGRKISKSLEVKSGTVLSRQLLVCVESSGLDDSDLFSSLRATFISI